jgi:hypothetical protein
MIWLPGHGWFHTLTLWAATISDSALKKAKPATITLKPSASSENDEMKRAALHPGLSPEWKERL